MSTAVTTFGWTTAPITTPPPVTFSPDMFRPAAELWSAIKYYENSLSADPTFTSMDGLASSAGMTTDPIGLASEMIATYTSAPQWYSDAPPELQTYVISIASAEQSLALNAPQPTGSAVYDASILSAMASMYQHVIDYENQLTVDPAFSSWASVAATATGLDNIQASRDPLSLAKELESATSTPTWYAQMPAPLQTYVQSIVTEEAGFYQTGLAEMQGADDDRPSLTSGGPRVKLCTAGVGLAAFLGLLWVM